MSSFDHFGISDDIIAYIFNFLRNDTRSMAACRMTCDRWRSILDMDCLLLPKILNLKNLPTWTTEGNDVICPRSNGGFKTMVDSFVLVKKRALNLKSVVLQNTAHCNRYCCVHYKSVDSKPASIYGVNYILGSCPAVTSIYAPACALDLFLVSGTYVNNIQHLTLDCKCTRHWAPMSDIMQCTQLNSLVLLNCGNCINLTSTGHNSQAMLFLTKLKYLTNVVVWESSDTIRLHHHRDDGNTVLYDLGIRNTIYVIATEHSYHVTFMMLQDGVFTADRMPVEIARAKFCQLGHLLQDVLPERLQDLLE